MRSREDQARMVAAYQTGISINDVASLIGASPDACRVALRRSGVPIRSITETRLAFGPLGLFEEVNTEIKAYWLGFISADAHIAERGVSITIARRDREHLESLRVTLGLDRPIREYRDQVRLVFGGRREVAALALLGQVALKPCRLVPPPIRLDLMRHFWRGVFDADGHVKIKPPVKRKSKRVTDSTRGRTPMKLEDRRPDFVMSLTGPLSYVQGFLDFIAEPLGTVAQPFVAGRVSHRVQIMGRHKCAALARLLYEGAMVSLERKSLVAAEMFK